MTVISCVEKTGSSKVVLNDLEHECVHRLTDVIVYDIFTPPVASRIYAYSNLAFYEAIRFKKTGSESIVLKLKGYDQMPIPNKQKKYNFTLSAVASFFKVAKALTFSKDSLTFTENKILKEFNLNLENEEYSNSISFGDSIANVILKRSKEDNYNKTRGMPKYSVFKEPGKWQQTPPDYGDAVEPNWSLLKPMLLDSSSQCKPVSPPPYNLSKTSEYYKQLMELYNLSKHITKTQDTIAHYWDDNPFVTEHRGHLMFATKKTTPGGHWMGIVSILCKQSKADEIKTAKVYALSACSIYDGFISCWDEKYRSRMVRPITVVRENIEPEWNSLLQTPSFPEYLSAHSVITAAVSTLLSKQFGENTPFNDTTEMEYLGLKRSFKNVKAASDEAGVSRLYGGIHFRSSITEGQKSGYQIGKLYNSKFN
ncbi:MAG: hypothetical protein NVSMB45_09570 [Ginsengibacter sp.]